jgi:hypothetical protein
LLWDEFNTIKPHWNTICNQFFNGWNIVQAQSFHWTNCCQFLLDNYSQFITWQSSLEIIHKGDNYLSQCKEGQVLRYLCQLYTHGGIGLNVIESIWWQTTLHGEGMAYHENIGVTCFIIVKSTIWIAIKPCKCDWRSILPKVEDVDDQPTLYKGLSQFILVGWSLPTWWWRCERGLK